MELPTNFNRQRLCFVMEDRILVKFKTFAEDFIVEEIRKEGICKISESKDLVEHSSTEISKLGPIGSRDFLTFDLEKINIDHFNALEIVAKKLRIGTHEIGYAGSKDKKAWTCQRISIFHPNLELIEKFAFNGICLKNFKWEKHKIDIGDLNGNHFKIILRDIDNKEAMKIMKKLRNSEFIPNFFGMQRFGSLRKDNIDIGKLIFKRKFKEAIWNFLTNFGENEGNEVKEAKKKLISEKNIKKALDYFPDKLKTEKNILEFLSENPDDFAGALMLIGEKNLLLICQAVQSKIFNDILQQTINEGIDLKNESIILPGLNTKFSLGRLGDIEKEVLKRNNLQFSDFHIPELPFLMFKGAYRKAFSQVREFNSELENDEIFSGSKKIILSFVLNSGTYATTFLEQFFILNEE